MVFLSSLYGLVTIGILLGFLIGVFGIMGLQMYNGALHYRCFNQPLSVLENIPSDELEMYMGDAFCRSDKMCRRRTGGDYPFCLPLG